MGPFSPKMTFSTAVFACCFVFLSVLGFGGNLSASCGDYLRHNSPKPSKIFSADESRDAQSGKLPLPATGCKNGNCGQTPPALPLDSVRVARLDANHLHSEFHFAHGVMDEFEIFEDLSPTQPSLDLPDPPPRDSAL